MMYVSDACIVFAGVVFAIFVGKHWDWGPFVAGLGVAVFGVGVHVLLLAILIAVIKPDAEEMRKIRPQARQRVLIIIAPAYMTFGLCFALVSGSVPSYWLDVVFAAMIVLLGLVVPLAFLPMLKRKTDAMRKNANSPG